MTTENEQARTAPDHANVAFHPPVLLFAAIVLGMLARWFLPLEFLPQSWASLAGPAVTMLSLALFAWAVTTMRLAGASVPTDEPTERLVFGGPYRFSRNPIYLSMALLLLGIAIWSNSAWFLLLAALDSALLNWGVISREERYLERKFGAAYSEYRGRVRRWC